MVKVKEFCCGCSLRSGTFTIAWVTLMYNCFLFVTNVYNFLYRYRRFEIYKNYSSDYRVYPPSSFIFAYNVIRTIAGIAVSMTALWALHKNKVIYLNSLLWYFCYIVAAIILDEILLIFKVDWEENLGETNLFLMYYSYENLENIVTLMMLYALMTGIVLYFALIVKSYRDYSLRNNAPNDEFVGPDATTVGYVAA